MVTVAQVFVWLILHLPLTFLLRSKITGLNLLPHKPFIIAANHPSKLDPFLLCLLPLVALRKIAPIYFLTAKYYYDKPYLKPLLNRLGSYPQVENAWTWEEFLIGSIKKLGRGNVVVVFPEGEVTKDERMSKPKPGVLFMSKHASVPIVPLHIHASSSFTITNFLLRKQHISLTFGRPIKTQDMLGSRETSRHEATQLMQIIYSL